MPPQFLALVLLSLAFVFPANAGVTIHYEGTAASPEAVTKILAAISAYAKKNKWEAKETSTAKGQLRRVVEDKDKDYEGKITGIVVRITENCEPLHFEFGDDLFMQDFVKTQFAGADVHIQIVQLFDSLRPLFKKIAVVDEGEYWNLRERAILERHIAKIDSMIEDIKKKNPKARGPLRMKSGRIADVIE